MYLGAMENAEMIFQRWDLGDDKNETGRYENIGVFSPFGNICK